MEAGTRCADNIERGEFKTRGTVESLTLVGMNNSALALLDAPMYSPYTSKVCRE